MKSDMGRTFYFFVLEPKEIEIGGSAVVGLFIFPASEAPDIAL